MAQLKEMDKFSLSDGGSIRITKLGRYYNYARLYNSLKTPLIGNILGLFGIISLVGLIIVSVVLS